MEFLKKNWSNLLLILFVVLLIVPQTRKPIQVGLNRLIAFSPTKISEGKRENLEDYSWNLKNLEGEVRNFQHSKGEVAIVNLWATWCPPCIAEMPSFQKLYNDYQGKVDFYFVSSEETEKLKLFLKNRNYDLPVYRPLTQIPEKLKSSSLPTTFVLSKKGDIVIKTTGSANWYDSGLRELLDGLLLE